MKKVLFIATVQSHIMNFHIPYLKLWQDKGYEVHVATNMDTKKYDNVDTIVSNIIWNNIDFDRSPFSKNTFIALKQLINLMNINRYELIHVHTPVGGILGRMAAKITNTRNVVYTAHGFHFYKGAPLKNWIIYYPIEKLMAKYTDALITMNEEDYQLAKSKFKTRIKDNIFKVNGVGIDLNKYSIPDVKNIEFKRSLGLKDDDFIITVVAELIERKNHKQIILAMEYLAKHYSNIKALFVGDGELYDSIANDIKNRGLESNIKLLGFRKDVDKILNITDIIGLFSHHEGLPKNIMEGMAAKKPIVCTRIRGNIDIIQNEKNGYLVEVNDIDDTVKKIEKLKAKIDNIDNDNFDHKINFRTDDEIKSLALSIEDMRMNLKMQLVIANFLCVHLISWGRCICCTVART